LDGKNLAWPPDNRNIYTAHEIAQIIPLVDKDNFYRRFIKENRWVLGYWPQALKISDRKPEKEERKKIEHHGSFLVGVWSAVGRFLESLAYRFQIWYMKGKLAARRLARAEPFFTRLI